jgi:hypothetical protein
VHHESIARLHPRDLDWNDANWAVSDEVCFSLDAVDSTVDLSP